MHETTWKREQYYELIIKKTVIFIKKCVPWEKPDVTSDKLQILLLDWPITS